MELSFRQVCTQIEQNVQTTVISLQHCLTVLQDMVLSLHQTEKCFNFGISVLQVEKQKLESQQNELQSKQQRLKKDQEQIKIQKKEIENEREKFEKDKRIFEEGTKINEGNMEEEKIREIEQILLLRKEISLERERLEKERREFEEEKINKIRSVRRKSHGKMEEKSERNNKVPKIDLGSQSVKTSRRTHISSQNLPRITSQVREPLLEKLNKQKCPMEERISPRRRLNRSEQETTPSMASPTQSPRMRNCSKPEIPSPRSEYRRNSKSKSPPTSVIRFKSPSAGDIPVLSLIFPPQSPRSPTPPREISPRRQGTTTTKPEQFKDLTPRDTREARDTREPRSPKITESPEEPGSPSLRRGKIDVPYVAEFSSGVSEDIIRNLPLILTKLVDVVSNFEETIKCLKGGSRGLDRDLCRRSVQDLVVVQKEVYNFFQGRYPELDTFLVSEFMPAIKNVGIATKGALAEGNFEELEKKLQVMRELPIKLLMIIRRISPSERKIR